MDPHERQEILRSLNQVMTTRTKNQAALQQHLKTFTSRLFEAIETVMATMEASGIPGLGKSRRLVHPAGGGREGLQVFIEDWSIIFVPLPGFARPNTSDEARIPPIQFKEPCGRIGVFLTDEPQGTAFYDFLIFQDGSWFAWGYGWPKQQADIDRTDFEGLALELLYSFAKDIFITWHGRNETTLATALDTKKRVYTFGLPGEEQQGI
ncbi:MAG: hypothetical protein EHM39_00115 [Chloroflexi bacterium]|nr:MAG: hypothetical protein EHM39_00115 [Chloroflexota bacterium]